MKKLLNFLDCMVVLSGITSFVFFFMYVGTLSSTNLHVFVWSSLSCYLCIVSADAVRVKKESERLSRMIKRMK